MTSSRARARLVVDLIGLVAAAAAAPEAGPMYSFGIADGENQTLDRISVTTGKRTPIGAPLAHELSGQQLSSFDTAKQRYYLLDFNSSTKAPNLLGINTRSGKLEVDIPLQLPESMFVGVGQYLAADSVTGCVVVAAADVTVKGYRVLNVCPDADPTPAHIATIPAPNVGLLGSASVCDTTRGVFYATMPLDPFFGGNGDSWHLPRESVDLWSLVGATATAASPFAAAPPPPPPPPPKFTIAIVAVQYKKVAGGPAVGTVTKIKLDPATNQMISTMAFDTIKHRVVGFGMTSGPAGYRKTLNYLDHDTGRFESIGEVTSKYVGEMGPITTVDSRARLHYSLLQRAPKSWVPDHSDCKSGCPTGTLCCQLPPTPGACFKVSDCAALTTPNMSAPFDLVAISLDDASLARADPPHLCAITGMKACPWSLESGRG